MAIKDWRDQLIALHNENLEPGEEKIVNLSDIKHRQKDQERYQKTINKYETGHVSNNYERFTRADKDYRENQKSANKVIEQFHDEHTYKKMVEKGIIKGYEFKHDEESQHRGVDVVFTLPDGSKANIEIKSQVTRPGHINEGPDDPIEYRPMPETYVFEILTVSQVSKKMKEGFKEGEEEVKSFQDFGWGMSYARKTTFEPEKDPPITNRMQYDFPYHANYKNVKDLAEKGEESIKEMVSLYVDPYEQWNYLIVKMGLRPTSDEDRQIAADSVAQQARDVGNKIMQFYIKHEEEIKAGQISRNELYKMRTAPVYGINGEIVPGVHFSASYGKENNENGEPIHGSPVGIVFDNSVLMQLPGSRAFDTTRDDVNEMRICSKDRMLRFVREHQNDTYISPYKRGSVNEQKPFNWHREESELNKLKETTPEFKDPGDEEYKQRA